MAEELQRYNSQGVQIRVPKVDFTASKVQAQTMASLSQSLDRMSNYFFRVAEGQAKIQGAEYGAENAPTKEQIKASIESGEPIEVVGDQTTVFGQYARNASLTAVTDEIDYMMSLEMSKTIKEFNDSLDQPGSDANYEPDKLLDKLKAIVEGHSSALDDVSPGTARKLRASGGIKANAKFVSYADKWSNNEYAKSKSQFFAKIEMDDNELFDQISAYANDPQMLDFLITSYKNKRLADGSTFKLSQGELQNIANNFDKNLKKVANKIMLDEILKSEAIPGMQGKMLEELLKNPKSRNVSMAMASGLNILEQLGESRSDIVKNLFNEHQNKINFDQNQEINQINNNVREVKDVLGQAVTKWIRGETEEAEMLMGDYINANGGVILEGTGSQIEQWAKFKETQNSADVKDVDQVVVRLEAMGTNLTTDDVLKEFNLGNLSKTTTSGLINDAQKFADDKYKRAVKNVIYKAFQFEENVLILDPKGKDKLNIELKNEAQAEISTLYEQSLIDGTTQKINWSAEAQKIVDRLDKDLKPEIVLKEKSKSVRIIKAILTQVDDVSFKEQFKDLKAKDITEDQVQLMLDTLIKVRGEIDSPTDKPSGSFFSSAPPDPIQSYIRKLTKEYKRTTALLDKNIDILKQTLTLYSDD